MKISRVFRSKLVLLIIAPLVLFAPIIFSGKALFWGTLSTQFVPWREWAWNTLKSGQIPLWNPLLGMGAPLIANYQLAFFYPLNWLYFLFYELGGIGALAWLQAPIVAVHLAWSGLGMAFLARRLGMNTLSQTVSGLAFGLSGYLVARAGFLSINATVAWLPWVIGVSTILFEQMNSNWNEEITLYRFSLKILLKQLLKLIKLSKFSILILTIIMGMMLLAGHAQTSWYVIGLTMMWGIFIVVSQKGTPQTSMYFSGVKNIRFGAKLALYKILSVCIVLVFALAITVMLTAIQLIPTAEYLTQSQRSSEVDFEYGLTYSFWPWRFLTLVAPDMFGSPAAGNYWGYANYWEDAIYIGLLPLVLGLVAIVNGIKGRSNQKVEPSSKSISLNEIYRPTLARFLVVIILLSFLLALGKNTPVFPWLYRYVPTFDMFNAPTRFSLWAVFSIALLAGIGVEYWYRPTGRGLYWTRLGTAGAFAIMLGTGLAWLMMGDISPSFIRATALAGALFVGTGILTLTAPLKTSKENSDVGANDAKWRKHLWPWIVCLFVALDLVIAGWGLNPGVDLGFYQMEASTSAQIRELAGDGRLLMPFEDEYDLKFSRFFPFDTFDPGENWDNLRVVQLPNLTMLDKLVSANNFDPIVPRRYANWMDTIREADAETQRSLLNLMGVTVVEHVYLAGSNGIRFKPIESFSRFRWVPCGILATNAQNALDLVLSEVVDFRREVILEDIQPILVPLCELTAEGTVEIISESPNEIKMMIESTVPGFLVISDAWYPGWRAQIEGQEFDVLRANYLFKAVRLPTGKHELNLEYRPATFFFGSMVSSIFCIVILISLVFLARTRKKQRNSL